MQTNGAGILYLLKDRFQIYTSKASVVFAFPFPQQAVRDFCVLDKELLAKTVEEFIHNSSIQPTTLIIVIADEASCITDVDQQTLTAEQEHFQRHVPEEQLIVRKMHPSGDFKLFATNKELYMTLKHSFEQQGFHMEFVLPGYLFPNQLGRAKELTIDLATAIFKDAMSLQDYNLLAAPLAFAAQETAKVRKDLAFREQRKHDILHLYAMANVFGLLVIGLLVVWNITHQGPSQTYQGKAKTDQQVILPDRRETQQLTVKIVADPQSFKDARSLRELLKTYKFKEVLVQRKRLLGKSQVIFSSKTSPTVRSLVLTDVKKYAPDATFRDDPYAAIDIVIILTK